MDAEAEGRVAAEEFRATYRLGVQPLGDLVALIEQTTGFDVAVLDAGPDEHGLTMRDPQRGVVFIGVARSQRPMRQRSNLGHELGHVIFGDWVEPRDVKWGVRDDVERRADVFARHLLVPLAGLADFLAEHGPISHATLSAVVQRFLVSPALAAIQLCEGGHIDIATKREWIHVTTPELATRFGWSDQYRALQDEANHRRAPQRLLARAIRGYAESVVSAQAIATLRGAPLAEVEDDLQAAGVVSANRPVTWADPADLPIVEVDHAELDAILGALDESDNRGAE
ncbi:toxin-antitoxin system, toxin component [Amycolatopsis thailandensis]|uniref:Toxin-antitoxin system, toxin component n=1 Tax=Amycolatopsis thailandensis TaxID=589330 RepID=A0A229RU93_9PSEU|nr:ImmA/IrrE family metallo-endopeptidase [Amycolatopsis thailandensis]OXM50238.1 toxin-antitoxin system, toxin component [Amycolatopsis thailandensis]